MLCRPAILTGMVTARQFFPRPKVSGEDHRVTTFELLFDLVFVFAFTQVTGFMAHTHNAIGVLQALVILAIIWWSWTSYGWLANQTHVDEGIVRAGMAVGMGAMFVVAMVIPESFEHQPGGLSGPIVFVVAYFVVRFTHGLLYLVAAGDDRGLRSQVVRTSVAMFSGTALLLAGAIVGNPWQTWMWLGGILLDFVLTFITSIGGDWRLQSPAHWAERYGLIIILALGESVVAIGAGAAREQTSVLLLVGAVLAIGLSFLLWWLYFDVTASAAEWYLARRTGVERAELASYGYTYGHFLLIAGIVISALGVEETIAEVAAPAPIGLFTACALFGGTSLYLGGHALFWRLVSREWNWWRVSGGTALLALTAAGAQLSALAALATVVAVVVVVVVFESRYYAQQRSHVRAVNGDKA